MKVGILRSVIGVTVFLSVLILRPSLEYGLTPVVYATAEVSPTGKPTQAQAAIDCPACEAAQTGTPLQGVEQDHLKVIEALEKDEEIACESGTMLAPAQTRPLPEWTDQEKQIVELFGKTSIFADRLEVLKELRVPPFTPLELAVLQEYTDGGYGKINSALTSKSPVLRKRWQPVIDTLNSALRRLPPYTGTVVRRAHGGPENLRGWRRGDPFRFGFFASSSWGREHVHFGNVRYVIHSKQGREISLLSLVPHEQEVLFPSDAQFRVKSVDKRNLTIELEDLPPHERLPFTPSQGPGAEDLDVRVLSWLNGRLRFETIAKARRLLRLGGIDFSAQLTSRDLIALRAVGLGYFTEQRGSRTPALRQVGDQLTSYLEAAQAKLTTCEGTIRLQVYESPCLMDVLRRVKPGTVVKLPRGCAVGGQALSKKEPDEAGIVIHVKKAKQLGPIYEWQAPYALLRPGAKLRLISRSKKSGLYELEEVL